jgi:hypothetical protein
MTLPDQQYDVLLLDPPWSYHGQQDKWGAAAKFYDLMTDDERLWASLLRLQARVREQAAVLLLDLVLAASIGSSLVVLLVALQTTNPLDFSSFPALLLLLTLRRDEVLQRAHAALQH